MRCDQCEPCATSVAISEGYDSLDAMIAEECGG